MEHASGRPPAAAPVYRGWRRLVPHSLTARLVTGVVVLVVLVVSTTAVGTYVALRSFLFTRLDQQVRATLAQTPQVVQESQGAPDATRPRAPQRVWWLLITAGVVAEHPPETDGGDAALQLNQQTVTQLVTDATDGPQRIRVLKTVDGEQVRVAARVVGAPGARAVFAVGLSQSEVERTLRRLVELELIIGTAAVVMALGAGRYLVRFNLRQLHRVTHTAQEVAAELSPEGRGLERRVSVDEPETEVGRLAESMNTLLAAVETQFAARLESEQRMRQFLADASHELRTPLTSIRGFAELARMRRRDSGVDQGADQASQADQADRADLDDLARIEAEGTRMSRLVDDLLLLARGDQGAAAEQLPVTVLEMLDDAVSAVRVAHPTRRIEVHAADGLCLVGDYNQLVRAVRNLVANAAAYTRPDGPVLVDAHPDGPGVLITVTDSGPGLTAEQCAHAFERFWRADEARSRRHGGSGLGLSIVESIARGHGGWVSLRSSVEAGSTVSIWLPGVPEG